MTVRASRNRAPKEYSEGCVSVHTNAYNPIITSI